MSAWRPFALLLAMTVVATPCPTLAQATDAIAKSPAPPPVRLHRGVVVVAAANAPIGETWNLAIAVYQDPALRPRGMTDATARALAGEAPSPRATKRVRDLFEVRASLPADGAATRRILASIASELGVSGVLLVHQTKAGQPRARLFVAKRVDFADPTLWPQPDATGRASWASSVAWLSSLTGSTAKTTQGQDGGSVFGSPWFWGALTAAAGVVLVGYVASRDEAPTTIHLQGRVNP